MKRETERASEREERRDDRRTGTATAAPGERRRTSPAEFLREVRSELKKVAWPNRHEVLSYTLVVLVFTAVLSLFVFGLDMLFREAIFNLF